MNIYILVSLNPDIRINLLSVNTLTEDKSFGNSADYKRTYTKAMIQTGNKCFANFVVHFLILAVRKGYWEVYQSLKWSDPAFCFLISKIRNFSAHSSVDRALCFPVSQKILITSTLYVFLKQGQLDS